MHKYEYIITVANCKLHADAKLIAVLGSDAVFVMKESVGLIQLYLKNKMLLEFDESMEPITLLQHIHTAFQAIIIAYYGDVDELWEGLTL